MHIRKLAAGLAGISLATIAALPDASAQNFTILNCLGQTITYQAGAYAEPRNLRRINWQDHALAPGQQHVWPVGTIKRDDAYGLYFAWRHPAFVNLRRDQSGNIIYAHFGPPNLAGDTRANFFPYGDQIRVDSSGNPNCGR